jgi:putative ABC transport system substrate-binding protein
MELLTREVRNPREVATAVNNLKGMVNAFWMLPDTSVVTPETVELFLLASQEYNIPVISFAGKYVEMGALAALDIDVFDQGTQAGEMAINILNGTAIADVRASEARSAPVKINRSVAKKLGITLPQ